MMHDRLNDPEQELVQSLRAIKAFIMVQRALDPQKFGPLDGEILRITNEALTHAKGGQT